MSTATKSASTRMATAFRSGRTRTRLGDLARFINGDAYKPSDWSTCGAPIIRIQNLNDASKPFNYWAGALSECVVVRAGDVLLAWSGTPGTSFGAHRWAGPDGVLNQHIFRVDLNTKLVDPDWFVFAVNEALHVLIAKAHGGVGLRHVNKGEVEQLELNLPPLKEQERIAAWLTAGMAEVEQARQAAQARLRASEALTESYRREVFGDVHPFTASPLIPTEPTRPGWRWCLLTNIARLATGHTPSRREPMWWGGDIQWLQLPDIRAVDGKRVFTTQEQTNALGIANSSSVLLPEGTVCMSRTASVGFVTIMGRAMATSQDFVNWICGPELDPEFLMQLLIACRKPIRALGSGATHHSIYFQTVESFAICVPPIADQHHIATELSERLVSAEQLTRAIQSELQAIESLPSSLVRQAFGATEDRHE